MSKFKVGEQVLYMEEDKAKIFGIADKMDNWGRKYAITYNDLGYKINKVVSKDTLSKLPQNKFKQGDVLELKDYPEHKYMLLKYNDSKYNVAQFRNNDYEIITLNKAFTENNFKKVGEIDE